LSATEKKKPIVGEKRKGEIASSMKEKPLKGFCHQEKKEKVA